MGGDVRDRADEVVDDGNGGDLRRARERVEVDDHLHFPHFAERLGAIAVLQGDEHDVGGVDTVGSDFRALACETGNPCVRMLSFDLRSPVCAEVVGDGGDALVGAIEEVHLDGRPRRVGEGDDPVGHQRRGVAVDRDDGLLRAKEVGGGGALGALGARDGSLAEQIVEGFAAALGDESLLVSETGIDAGFDTMAGAQRVAAGVLVGHLGRHGYTARPLGKSLTPVVRPHGRWHRPPGRSPRRSTRRRVRPPSRRASPSPPRPSVREPRRWRAPRAG